MGRKLSGSIRGLGDRFEASVPERRGSKARVYEYLATKQAAERWCAAAVDALDADEAVPTAAALGLGLREAPTGTSSPGATARHFFARGTEAWHHERYVQLRAAQPDRASKVDDLLRLHIVPFFTTMISRPDQFDRALVVRFLLRLTGSSEAEYRIDEAANNAEISERRIRRMIDRGDLSVVGRDASGRALVRLGALEVALGVPRLRAAYAKSTVQGILGILGMIELCWMAARQIERFGTSDFPVRT